MRPHLFGLGLLGISTTVALACAKGTSIEDTGDDEGASSAGGAGGAGGSGGAVSSSSVVSSASAGGSGGTGGMACTEMPCKLVEPQCGCTEPDEACTVEMPTMANPSGRICAKFGDTAIGGLCGVANKCVPGSFCANASGYSACLEFCDDDIQCNAPGGICVMKLNYGAAMTEYPDLLMCSTNCDPATNVGCNAGGSCQVAQEQTGMMRFFTICLGDGVGVQDSPCMGSNECAATFGCFQPVNTCLKWCNLAQPNCPVGTGCNNLNPVVTIGAVTYGVCQ